MSDTIPLADFRERDRIRKSRERQQARDLEIPKIANPRRRRRCEKDIFVFLRTYFPDVFTGPFTKIRTEIVELLLRAVTEGGDQAVAAPRGEGKTAIVECVVIYCINTGRLRFPFIACATGRDAARVLSNIKYQYETNDLLAEDYPEICVPIQALEGASIRAHTQTVAGKRTRIEWSKDHVVFPTVPGSRASGAVVATSGLDGAIRGMRFNSLRPDLVVIDDPETAESAVSQPQIESRESVIERDLAGLGGPGVQLGRILLTTLQAPESVSAKFTDPAVKPSWNGKRYRLVESWPDRSDLWDEYQLIRRECQQAGDPKAKKATSFYRKHRKDMDAGASVSNEFRHIKDRGELTTLQHAYNVICDRGMSAFLTEYQNDPPLDDMPQTNGLTAEVVQQKLNGVARNAVPDGCDLLTVGVDVGKYLCHYTVIAWDEGSCGHIVDYAVLEVFPADKDDAELVERAITASLSEFRGELTEHPYRTLSGEPVSPSCVMVDAAHFTNAVYQFCLSSNRHLWRPYHGVGESGDRRAKIDGQSTKTKKVGEEWAFYQQGNGLWLCMGNADYWKLRVHEGFLAAAGKSGSLSLYGNERRDHIRFAHHITAEQQEEQFVRKGGKGWVTTWKVVGKHNHWLDATSMACVAASVRGMRLHKPRATKPPAKQSSNVASRPKQGRRGFNFRRRK